MAADVVDIAGVGVHSISFEEAVQWIVDRAGSGTGAVVCTPNVDYVVRCQRDAAFRGAVASADLRLPDGMWIVYASRIAGTGLRGTVTGRLLLPAIAARASLRNLPIALYGAGPGIAEVAAQVLRNQAPDLEVSAAISPPFRLEIGSPTDIDNVRVLAASGARVVFVALGAPKQEIWMATHRDALPGVVLVGVGAAFDIVAGRFREAPRWMTRVGLEWLFRLAQEPRRLARRYLKDDPWILVWAARRRLGLDGPVRRRQ